MRKHKLTIQYENELFLFWQEYVNLNTRKHDNTQATRRFNMTENTVRSLIDDATA